MSKLFQIHEDDLETLESAFPEIQESLPSDVLNRKDIQEHLEMVKSVLSNVRWNYGIEIDQLALKNGFEYHKIAEQPNDCDRCGKASIGDRIWMRPNPYFENSLDQARLHTCDKCLLKKHR